MAPCNSNVTAAYNRANASAHNKVHFQGDDILTFQGNVHSAGFLPLCKYLAQVYLKSELFLEISAIVSLEGKKELTLRQE